MKRIQTTTSRTAEWTCVARAVSSLEKDAHFRCDDYVARMLLPRPLRIVLRIPAARAIYKATAPKGLYNYVVARTKYVDAAFADA